ncbi:MAG: ABC transporter permease, partial [Balneolaceae bacterium]|nr:ABC transporter permease [Balneolaceae bacterium]
MIENYLRVAFRNLGKHKGYAFINITGLAIGIACCLLILLYIFKELSYDRFNTRSDRVYRVVRTMTSESRQDAGASTSFPVGPTLASEYPHLIETSVRFYNLQVPKLSLGFREDEVYFKEPNLFFVDSTFFDVFSAELIQGNPETALSSPQSLVITESMVEKYFGDDDPLGRQLFFEGRIDLTVTGVMKDWPDNSHIDIDFLASMNTLDVFYKSEYAYSWYWNPCWTYILLEEETQVQELENQLPLFVEKYHDNNIPATDRAELDLQPLTSIHLHSNLDQEIQANSNIRYIYIFSIAAVLILFIACFNFMNLATARSARRSKEVGMRKVLGADRLRLFLQFMGESYLTSFLAILLSLLFVYLMLPFFNAMLGTSLEFSLLSNGWILSGLVLLFVLVGTLAGTYPAVFLSGFRPIRTVRGDLTHSRKGQLFRRVLVVLQFGFSILLIIGTAIVFQQLNLLREKNMGFENEEIVIMPTDLTRTIWYYEDFSQRLMQSPYIKSVTGTKNVLGSLKNIYHKYTPEGYAQPLSIPSIFVMYDFFETYDINLLAGRSFSR